MVDRSRRLRPTRAPRPDFLLLGATAALLVIGLAVMASIGEARDAMGREPRGILARHLPRVVLGIIVCFVGARIRVDTWKHLAKPFLIVALASLAFTVMPRLGLGIEGIHVARNGAFRWLQIGPLSLMPGEFFKAAFLLWLAHYLSLEGTACTSPRGLAHPLVMCGVALLLLVLQPSVSTAVGVACTTAAMLYLAGGPVPSVRAVLCVALLVTGSLMVTAGSWSADAASPEPEEEALTSASARPAGMLRIWTYAKNRLGGYVPIWRWEPRRLCYHSRQSLIALGFGGITGQGLGNGRHSYGRLPESHTDYPLAAIGEELGWIGTSVVVVAWSLILIRGMRIARNAPDLYRFLLASGLTLNLVLFAAVNAAVVTALLPVTGQGMPFVSYGGGGMLMSFLSIGVLDAINRSSA